MPRILFLLRLMLLSFSGKGIGTSENKVETFNPTEALKTLLLLGNGLSPHSLREHRTSKTIVGDVQLFRPFDQNIIGQRRRIKPNRRHKCMRAGTSQMLASSSSPLALSSRSLLQAADGIIVAAEYLGESGNGGESPEQLWCIGRVLANAACTFEMAAVDLGQHNWMRAAELLGNSAEQFQVAAASFRNGDGSEHLDTVGAELLEASQVTGCIQLAAAAGPNLQAAGKALREVASVIDVRGLDLASGTTLAHILQESAESISAAGSHLEAMGTLLEEGQVPLEE